MRKRLRIVLACLALAGLAVTVPVALARTRTIKVGDFFFVRDTNGTPTAHVSRGTIVRWKFVGFATHNVTVIRGPVKFRSRDMDHGVYRHRLTRTGVYLIECTIHGFKMRLVVGHPKTSKTPSGPTGPTGPTGPYPY